MLQFWDWLQCTYDWFSSNHRTTQCHQKSFQLRGRRIFCATWKVANSRSSQLLSKTSLQHESNFQACNNATEIIGDHFQSQKYFLCLLFFWSQSSQFSPRWNSVRSSRWGWQNLSLKLFQWFTKVILSSRWSCQVSSSLQSVTKGVSDKATYWAVCKS